MSPSRPEISGSTRIFCIIGDPIDQVKSPQTFNPRFAAAGFDAVLIPVHVEPDRFDETVRGLMAVANLDGIIVTVPYKVRVLPLAHRLSRTARTVGAANALRREEDGTWSGDMFDGTGLVRGLRERGHDPAGRRIMLLGAGGAGSAVAVALADAGASAITIHDVDADKAGALAARVVAHVPAVKVEAGPVDLSRHDTLVNATPTGMKEGDGPPVPLAGLSPGTLVVDIIMKPEVTPLLAHARALGCTALGGRTMLDGQADEVARFFRITGT